jgi:hypothetical protein
MKRLIILGIVVFAGLIAIPPGQADQPNAKPVKITDPVPLPVWVENPNNDPLPVTVENIKPIKSGYRYIGLSIDTTTGYAVGGRSGMNRLCRDSFPEIMGVRMCTTVEYVRSPVYETRQRAWIQPVWQDCGAYRMPPDFEEYAWYCTESGSSLMFRANDGALMNGFDGEFACHRWQSSWGNDYGMSLRIEYIEFGLASCGDEHPVACCAPE